MYPVSTTYQNYINTSRTRIPKSKIVVDGVTYTGESHLKIYPKISHSTSKMVGGFPVKTCTFEIYNRTGNINLNGKEVTVYRGLEINGTVEWVPMGIFSATNDNITNNKTSKVIAFKGSDRTTVFDCVYSGSPTYPCTLLQFVQEICTRHSIVLETTSFPFATSWTLAAKPNISDEVTDRELISRVAELGGCIAQISRTGGLIISKPYNTGATINKTTRYKTVSREPVFGTINSVALGHHDYDDDITYPATAPENLCEWRIEDNPFVNDIREDVIEDIADEIIGMSIIPFQLNECVDDFIFDINDVVSIQDKDGTYFSTTILGYDTTSRIKSTLNAESQDGNSTDYALSGSVTQSINQVKLLVDHQNNIIQSLVTGLSDLSEETSTSITQTANSILAQVQTNYASKSEVQILSDSVTLRFANLATPSGISNAVTTINAQGVSIINGALSLYDNDDNLLIGVNTDGTGNMYVTGKISADAITTGTLNSNCIAAGAITADKIAAGSITAAKLAVGDFTNYCMLNDNTVDEWGFVANTSKSGYYYPSSWSSNVDVSDWYDYQPGLAFRVTGDIFTNAYRNGTGYLMSQITLLLQLSNGSTVVCVEPSGAAYVAAISSGKTAHFDYTINPEEQTTSDIVKFKVVLRHASGLVPTSGNTSVSNITVRCINSDAGTIVAGRLQSSDGSSYFDLDNNLLVSSNAILSGTLTALSRDSNGNDKIKLTIDGDAWDTANGGVTYVKCLDASDNSEVGVLKFAKGYSGTKSAWLLCDSGFIHIGDQNTSSATLQCCAAAVSVDSTGTVALLGNVLVSGNITLSGAGTIVSNSTLFTSFSHTRNYNGTSGFYDSKTIKTGAGVVTYSNGYKYQSAALELSSSGTVVARLDVTESWGTARGVITVLSSSGRSAALELGSSAAWFNGNQFTSSSSEKYKTNIAEYAANALELVNNAKVYSFNYTDDYTRLDTPKTKYGLVIERECPSEVVDDSGDAVSLYSMISILWKAVQELSAKINEGGEKNA